MKSKKIKNTYYFIIIIVISVLISFFVYYNKVYESFSNKKKIYGLTFSYRSLSPSDVNKESITRLLKIVDKHTDRMRLYNTDDLSLILQIIREEKLSLKLLVGLWTNVSEKIKDDSGEVIDANREQRSTQLANLRLALQEHGSKNILGISLTNEGFYRTTYISDFDKKDAEMGLRRMIYLADRINKIVKDLKLSEIPLGICEVPDFITNKFNNIFDVNHSETNKNLYNIFIRKLDFIGVNLHPLYTIGSSITPEESRRIVLDDYDKLKKMINNNYSNIKSLIISEVGFPTGGSLNSKGAKSKFTVENQKKYFNMMINDMKDRNIPYYWFSAFDNNPRTPEFESNWGLYRITKKGPNDYDIKLKYNI